MNSARFKALGEQVKAVALRGADVAERGLRRFYASVRRKLSPPVSVYRKKDTLIIVDAPRIGGRVHVARMGDFGPTHSGSDSADARRAAFGSTNNRVHTDIRTMRTNAFIYLIMSAIADLPGMLNDNKVREYLPFPKLHELLLDSAVSRNKRLKIYEFLHEMPGYEVEKGEAQSSTFFEQYGQLQMHAYRILFQGEQIHLSQQPDYSANDRRQISLVESSLIIGGATLGYPDAATAQVAFNQVKRALLPAGWSTWAARVVAVLLVFVLVRGVLAGMSATAGAGALAQDVAGDKLQGIAAAMADNPSFVPPDPAPQSLPGEEPVGGELADRIYRQSMATSQGTMHDQMPPQPSASVEGLEGFGLKDGPDQSGPGCDPALAFKVGQ